MKNLTSKKFNYTYQTKNLINGKTYIGVHSTNNMNDGYLGSGDKLAFSIKIYGKENFKLEALCFFDTKKEAFEEESFLVNNEWVQDRNNYNMTLGGFAPPSWTGKKVSEETKRKISLKNTGKIRSAETRKLIGDIQRGKKVTNIETLAKRSASMMGKNRGPKSAGTIAKQKETKRLNPYIITEETRKKLSIASKGRFLSKESLDKRAKTRRKNANPIIVSCIKTGDIIGTFFCCMDIVRELKISKAAIDRAINGRILTIPKKYLIKRII